MPHSPGKVTQFIHYPLVGDSPPDVHAVISGLLERGFIGQLRLHFDGSHTQVRGGEIVVKKNSLAEPLTDGPPVG